MSKQYAGQCMGGPHDGEMLAHWAKRKEFFRPMVAMTMNEDAPVEPVSIGDYRFNSTGFKNDEHAAVEHGVWHWWATNEGRAMDVLYGKAGGPRG